jgi:hypothetical protein
LENLKEYVTRTEYILEDIINIDLGEIGYENVNWIYLAQKKKRNSCEQGNESSFSLKGGNFL